jgi:ubiquinone/menaquinone biosynthesis C-methylase UbiE
MCYGCLTHATSTEGWIGVIMTDRKHSQEILSDLRDDWWNSDYLELVADRLQLGAIEKALDVGCGHGHWGQRILPFLSSTAQLEGVDQEIAWAEKATSRLEGTPLAARCHYRQSDAASLPYPDASFDLVTCQTLLMHVPDPGLCLAEMFRVLRPGGRLLAAEPSNISNLFSTDSVNRALSLEQLADLARFFFACSRGKARLGRGDDCIADVLPGLMESAGFSDIHAFQNDRPQLVLPPYASGIQASLEEELGHQAKRYWLWDKPDARVLYEAGGGGAEHFERCYAAFLDKTHLLRSQVEAGTCTRTGGAAHYLIAGVR